MDERMLRKLDAFIYGIDVVFHRARQRRNRYPVADRAHNLLDRLKIARGRRREPRFDDVDVQPLQLLGKLDLLLHVQFCAGHLLPVAQRRVQNDNVTVHCSFLPKVI